MKIAFLTGLALSACMAVQAADPAPASTTPAAAPAGDAASVLKSDVDKFSYSIGLNLGTNIKQQQVDVNGEAIIRGLQDGLGGKTPLMTQQEIQEIRESFTKQIRAKQEARVKEMREKNKGIGDAFMAENAKKPGIKTNESGLQYKVIKEGTGPKPKTTDRVAVNYRGTLSNGTEFDASSKRGPDPAVLPVSGGMIKGWTEALTNMNVGSKWEVYIPANLGYGENGRGPTIEPNSPLIFEIELVDIKQPEPPPQPVTSDIIKVPSKAELDAGAKIEVIKPEDLAKYTNNANAKGATNGSVKIAPVKK